MTDAVLKNIMTKLEGNIDDLDGIETLRLFLNICILMTVTKIRKWSGKVLRGDQVHHLTKWTNSSR
jgi:hypothetical protein